MLILSIAAGIILAVVILVAIALVIDTFGPWLPRPSRITAEQEARMHAKIAARLQREAEELARPLTWASAAISVGFSLVSLVAAEFVLLVILSILAPFKH